MLMYEPTVVQTQLGHKTTTRNMNPQHIVLTGLILMLIGFITPRVAPSIGQILPVSAALALCYIVGLLMLIIGGIRASRAKKKE